MIAVLEFSCLLCLELPQTVQVIKEHQHDLFITFIIKIQEDCLVPGHSIALEKVSAKNPTVRGCVESTLVISVPDHMNP